MKKVCFKCGNEKELSEFYKHKEMADGFLNKCKECTKNDALKHREKNIEKIRAYDRNRPNHKERVEANKKRLKENTELKAKYRKSQKKWDIENKIKKNAHTKVKRALLNGTLVRRYNCDICGDGSKLEAHHEDYSKPLEVIWLCVKCHKEKHKQKREIERAS